MKSPKEVEITEVGPRNGFQNIKSGYQSNQTGNYQFIDCCGFKIEATAFVNPKQFRRWPMPQKLLQHSSVNITM